MATKKKTAKKKTSAQKAHNEKILAQAKCLYCGKLLVAAEGKRAKKYCNDVCRSSHHQKTARGTFNVKAGDANRAISTETKKQNLSPYLLSLQKTKALGKK